MFDDREAAKLIRNVSPLVVKEMNHLFMQTFKTRGGRLGSGMGLLIEGLWGYYTSRALSDHGIEISWIAEDQYNDYAVTFSDLDWDPVDQSGELLRIEAKSMNVGADETKAHFAELEGSIAENDLLLILLWRWADLGDSRYVAPQIVDVFLDRAKPIARLRDQLHLARGGTFVDSANCPDGCDPKLCQHGGEPLNRNGKRERITGPETRRPSVNVSFAANFGGLKRMVAVRGKTAQELRASIARDEPIAENYLRFILQKGVPTS